MPPDAVISRPPRDTRMDIMRGYLQLVIFAAHAYGSFIGGWFIHAAWGFSDSSEQFVFLSGFTLGSVFALKMHRQGHAAATWDMAQRAARLYRTHLMVMALFFTVLVLACEVTTRLPMEAARLGWGYFIAHPFLALPALLATLFQPDFMGILPVFVWCMLALPLFAWAERRWGDRALAGSFALWLASFAFGIAPPGVASHIAFNPLAWQFLFLFGAWLGRRALVRGEALPASRLLTVAAAVLVLGALYLRVAWLDIGLPVPFAEPAWLLEKSGLAPLTLAHALALAWLVSVLVPREAPWMHRAVGNWFAAIGRHSLQVFCLGLFLSWLTTVGYRLLPGLWWLDPLMILAGALVLGSFARWVDGSRARARVVVPA